MNRRQSLGGGARGFSPLKGKNSFTLAEVLITLGVIGIVAALTLPTVIQHHKKQEATARLKKFVSTMEQAIMLSELDNGPAGDWEKQDIVWEDRDENKVDSAAQNELINKFYARYLKKYLKTVKIDEVAPDEKSHSMIIYFADGSTAKFYNGACIDIQFDVNGNKNPNSSGKDIFTFLLCIEKSKLKTFHPISNKAFGTYYEFEKREEALNECAAQNSHCTNLLQFDNWEFKDDYPYKL